MRGIRSFSTCLKMHTTQELRQASMHDPVLAPIMKEVFPSDKSPIVDTHPTAMIANTDPHNQPGTYWIAMYFVCLKRANSLTAMDFLLRAMVWVDTY